jgi:hypothetical protein
LPDRVCRAVVCGCVWCGGRPAQSSRPSRWGLMTARARTHARKQTNKQTNTLTPHLADQNPLGPRGGQTKGGPRSATPPSRLREQVPERACLLPSPLEHPPTPPPPALAREPGGRRCFPWSIASFPALLLPSSLPSRPAPPAARRPAAAAQQAASGAPCLASFMHPKKPCCHRRISQPNRALTVLEVAATTASSSSITLARPSADPTTRRPDDPSFFLLCARARPQQGPRGRLRTLRHPCPDSMGEARSPGRRIEARRRRGMGRVPLGAAAARCASARARAPWPRGAVC